MLSVYQIYQSVSNSSIKFGFYSSSGKLFAYGNASQGIKFFPEIGEGADYHGELPKVIPTEKLEPEDKVEYLHRFLLALCDLEQAYARIEELSPEQED